MNTVALRLELSTCSTRATCRPPGGPPPWFAPQLTRHALAQGDSCQGRCASAGALPAWLRGTLLRAGPGLWEVGSRQLRHVADGNNSRRGSRLGVLGGIARKPARCALQAGLGRLDDASRLTER